MSDSVRPPSVDAVTRRLAGRPELAALPRPFLVDAVRAAIATHPNDAENVAAALARVASRRLLMPVINATGTLLHTNLGRSPRPAQAGSPTSPGSAVRGVNIELDRMRLTVSA